MVARGISTSRGVRSSARHEKDSVQKEGDKKQKAFENGKIDRTEVVEKKLLKDKEMKSDLASDSSVVNKGSTKTNLLKNKDEDRRSRSSVRKERHERTIRDRKDDRTNGKSESERKRKEKHEKTSDAKISVGKGKRKRGHEEGGKNTSKLEKDIKSDNDEVDFSKIESKIFEIQAGNEASVEKEKRSGREKGKDREVVSRSKHVLPRSGTSKALNKGKDNKKVNKDGAQKSRTVKKGRNKEQVDGSDSDASDWEEVDDRHEEINELEALLDDSQDVKLLAKQSVKIELDAPDVIWGMKKRKKRRTEQEMIEEYLRKSVNRSIKEVYENMHKTHLLCLFAHGQYINKSLNSDILLGAALSIIMDKNVYPPKRLDMNYLEKFVSWFSRKVTVKTQALEDDYWSHPLEVMLAKRFESKTAFCNREFVYMFVILCRALGMNVRLIISLQPMSWKPTAGALIKRLKEEKEVSSINEPSCSKSVDMFVSETKVKEEKTKVKNNRKMLSSDSDIEMKANKNKTKSSKNKVSVGKPPPKKKSKRSSSSDDNDSDFDPTVKVKKGPKVGNKSKKRSSGEGSSGGGTKRKLDEKEEKKEGKRRKAEPLIEWVEIYVEEEEKWMCVDITKAKIHCIPEIEARTPSSSAHITAFNADLTVKDVTRRYIASWLANENKVRCCSKWWGKVMRAFKGKSSRRDKEEDDEMDQNLRQQPLPKVIGEYKNHPLYALQRHLLKFESLYPPDEAPVGYIKGEPVYSRESVYTLRSRDTWMKEAKTVRVDEEPYKIVKARPKWDRETCQVIKDRPLELFGEWQVEDFEPPVATGGKVPRNEYGNVELFKPTMLPKGCVHLPIAGLNRIARKLNIDCAPAMIGFDFHSGWTHPVYEGYVVCEEFKDTLLDAWNEDQVEQARREKEKQEKRIYNNWKKLIHGMMVKERVREKYGNSLPSEAETETQSQEVYSKESEDQSQDKRGKESKKSNQKKSKVTQEDIDAERPAMVTHKVRNLKIDLTSNVVDMAKESRKSTMKTNNTVKAKTRKGKGKSSQPSQKKEADLNDSSEESEDEEEKKARIRAILQWGTRAANENPNLSDDSDNEENSRPTSSKLLNLPSHWQTATTTRITSNQKNAKKRNKKLSSFEHASDSSNATSRSPTPESNASSRSTTPECYVNTVHDTAPRKGLQRSAKKKTVKYEESDEGDISLDESDVDDKTYNPLKKGSDNVINNEDDILNLSESD